MMDIKAAQLTQVSAGKLVDLLRNNEAWHFVFENGLHVVSYAGWNLFKHDYGAKPVIGSRDLACSEEPFKTLDTLLAGATFEVVTFNALNNNTRLEFLRDDDQLSLELLINSAKFANWKIFNDEFEESDID